MKINLSQNPYHTLKIMTGREAATQTSVPCFGFSPSSTHLFEFPFHISLPHSPTDTLLQNQHELKSSKHKLKASQSQVNSSEKTKSVLQR